MTDHSRGILPPAENLQYEPSARRAVGWPATFVLCALLAVFVGWLVLR